MFKKYKYNILYSLTKLYEKYNITQYILMCQVIGYMHVYQKVQVGKKISDMYIKDKQIA